MHQNYSTSISIGSNPDNKILCCGTDDSIHYNLGRSIMALTPFISHRLERFESKFTTVIRLSGLNQRPSGDIG